MFPLGRAVSHRRPPFWPSSPPSGGKVSARASRLPRVVGANFASGAPVGRPLLWASSRCKRGRSGLACRVVGSAAVDAVRETAQRVTEAVVRTVNVLHDVVWVRGWARVTVLLALLVGLVTAVLNTWLLGSVNARVLPVVTEELATVLEREVYFGKVKWLLPTGIFGLTPLASIGPVRVGPGAVEKSSIEVPEVRMGLNLLKSMFQRRLVLWANCRQPDVTLVQADNLSWFGYPQDTTPSSQNLLPGLGKLKQSTATGLSQQQSSSQATHVASMCREATDGNEERLKERRRSSLQCSTSEPTAAPAKGRRCLSPVDLDKLRGSFDFGESSEQWEKMSEWERMPDYDALGEGGRPFAWSSPTSHVEPRGTNPRWAFTVSVPHWQPKGPTSNLPGVSNIRGERAHPLLGGQGFWGGVYKSNADVLPGGLGGRGPSNPMRGGAGGMQTGKPSRYLKRKPTETSHGHMVKRIGKLAKGSGAHRPKMAPRVRYQRQKGLVGANEQEGASEDASAGAWQVAEDGQEGKSVVFCAKKSAWLRAVARHSMSVKGTVGAGKTKAGRQHIGSVQDVQHDSQLPPSAFNINDFRLEDPVDEKEQHAAWVTEVFGGGVEAMYEEEEDELGDVQEAELAAAEMNTSVAATVVEQRHDIPRKPWTPSKASSRFSVDWGALARHNTLPEVALGHMAVQNGTLNAFIAGESIPRRIEHVAGTASFGPGYHSMTINLHGKAEMRHPDSAKCTMPTPHAFRHLRFMMPELQKGLQIVFPSDITASVSQPTNTLAEAKRTPRHSLESSPSRALHKVSGSVMDDVAQGTEAGSASKDGKLGGAGVGPPGSMSLYSTMHDAPQRTGPWIARPKAVPFGRPQKGTRDFRRATSPDTGGDVTVNITAKQMGKPGVFPDLEVVVAGNRLHAPLLERIVEVPVDVHDGRADGTLCIKSYNDATWKTPQLEGRVKCQGLAFHFWDAPDDLSDADVDLIFEKNRMYVHNAHGYYGAVPLTVTGDMDIDPDVGQYRLSATVLPVEVNAVRVSLGIRPLPHSAVGAVRGIVHCNGPLQKPVFSGSGIAVRPTDEVINAMEESHAKSALLSDPRAVAAFDKVPFTRASVVFTHNTETAMFTVHEGQVSPVGGGTLTGSGQLWVAPQAEKDPSAIRVQMEGHGLMATGLVKRYVPEAVELPDVLNSGATSVKATMKGSHAAPRVHVTWEAPEVHATGSVDMSRESWRATARAPSFDVSGTLHTEFADFELTKTAYTQKAMTNLTTPEIIGVDADVNMKGCDVVPLLSNMSAVDRVTTGQALRLKLNGQTQISARRDAQGTGETASSEESAFSGDVHLQGIRVNQLNLARQLAGSLEFSPSSLHIHAKGLRADEQLDVDLNLPDTLLNGGGPFFQNEKRPEGLQAPAGTVDANAAPTEEAMEGQGGSFLLRQGRLLISTEANTSPSRVKMRIRGLTLDELELASLRGVLQDVSFDLNFDTMEGRGDILVNTPRYSGLLGESLSGAVRWEQEVLRLEKMVLQQKRSRYEVQGEYSLPPNFALPRDGAFAPNAGSSTQWSPGEVWAATTRKSLGRWRLQVMVPNADVQELLPAGRLLSRATSVTQQDYEKAKEAFLDGMKSYNIGSGELIDHLKATLREAGPGDQAGQPSEASSGGAGAALPGLQTLRGLWSGAIQAYGGGGGTDTLNFNIRGNSWQWGEYLIDQGAASGSYRSSEGVHIDEVSMRSGEAQLLIRGDLLGPKQDATILLNDFPAAMLSPMYKAVPALQHAAPAVSDRSLILKRLVERWEGVAQSVGISNGKEDTAATQLAKGSPVKGLLYVRGSVGGSVSSPEGVLSIRLYDGAVGPTQLSSAEAYLKVDEKRQVTLKLEAVPSEQRGMLKVEGTLPSFQEGDDLDVLITVRDGGMQLLSAIIPEYQWVGGSAMINMHVHGSVSKPHIEGGARVSRATLNMPTVKYPLNNVSAVVAMDENRVAVKHFEARSGRRGHIKIRGSLPMRKPKMQSDDAMNVELSSLELRLRNLYSGRLDSSLTVSNSLAQPLVSGDLQLSRGTAYLPAGSNSPSLAGNGGSEPSQRSRPAAEAFKSLGKSGMEARLEPQAGAMPGLPGSMGSVHLKNLNVTLGSELRAVYPLVVNLALSGNVELNGPLDPSAIVVNGTVQLDGGMVNLLATQLRVERDQPGRITFVPEQGLDPTLDLTLTAGEFKAVMQGRASNWQDMVVLSYVGTRSTTGEGTGQVQLTEASRLFQEQLASALVADNGQLAFSNLAASTVSTFSPKLDTQGQIGAARWRLVSAPSFPDMLSLLDPTVDWHNLLTSLITGTEVEVQFGKSVQAVVAHKLRGAEYGTQWTMLYNLNNNLRMQLQVANSPPVTRTLLLQYSSEGVPK